MTVVYIDTPSRADVLKEIEFIMNEPCEIIPKPKCEAHSIGIELSADCASIECATIVVAECPNMQVAPVKCPSEVTVAEECTMLIAPVEHVRMSNSTSEECPKVEVDNPEFENLLKEDCMVIEVATQSAE